jgi:NTP pyrophosphatase (non-canonical NTP hydrolase)
MNNKSWTLDIEEDPENGDAILNLPPDLLDAVGWVEGDVLDWEDNKDGTWTLTKKLILPMPGTAGSAILTFDTETKMNEKLSEVMDITQEECAEVIQAISKIRRFGLENHKYGETYTNAQHLEEELGDLLAMIDLLKSMGIVSDEGLNAAKQAKIEKLKKWSKIYE